MPLIDKSAATQNDLSDHCAYIFEKASERVAERLVTRVQEILELLATWPAIGRPLSLRNPALAGMRKWRVKDLDRFLVFCRPAADGIRVAPYRRSIDAPTRTAKR